MEEKKSRNQKYRREPKNRNVHLRMSESDTELLNKISYEEDLTISQIVRRAIRLYYDATKSKD